MILSVVKVACSLDWMMVQVVPHTYSGHQYILAEELHLGSGCPATRIETYAYHFVYLVSDCGIRAQVRLVIVRKNNLETLFQTFMPGAKIGCFFFFKVLFTYF